jgi:hypothetical protein
MTLKKDSPFSQKVLIAAGAIFVCPDQPTKGKICKVWWGNA